MDIDNLEQDIIKLSRKHNIPPDEVRKIWNYQFKGVMKKIKENVEDEEIEFKLRGLGIIQFSKYKCKRVKENKENKEKYESKIHRTETST